MMPIFMSCLPTPAKNFCGHTWTVSTKNFTDIDKDDVRNNFTDMDTNTKEECLRPWIPLDYIPS